MREHVVRCADGLRLHAVEHEGAGRALLCLHGLTRNGRDFATLAAQLSPRHRLILVDQRGRGGSARDPDPRHYQLPQYVDDMLCLVDQFGLSELLVIGTSMGGMLGLMLALRRPGLVRALVLNDVGAVLETAGLARIAGYVGKQGPAASLDEAAAQLALSQAAVFPDFAPSDWRQMAWETHVERDGRWWPDYDPAIAAGLADGSAAPPLWPLFEPLRGLPMLLLRGALSDLLSRDTVLAMQQRLPLMQSVEVPQRGHAPTLSEPAAQAALLPFLARHAS